MTYGILKSVNHKNKLYKNRMKINKDLPLFDNKKQKFNVYKNTLHRLINQAQKISIFQLSLKKIEVMAKKHGKQ